MKGTGFDSRCLQFLLTSFLLCAKFCPKQISPACTKKLRQHSYYVLSFVQNELGLCLKFEPIFTRWDGSVMVSMLVSHTNSPWFDSRWLQILFNFILTMCQVLSRTNFPCRYKKTTSTLLLCAKFCSKWIGIMFKIWANLYKMRW